MADVDLAIIGGGVAGLSAGLYAAWHRLDAVLLERMGTGGQIIKCLVQGPLGKPVEASYGILGDGRTAVIEMAEASGLPLVPRAERNPLATSTFGTGHLLWSSSASGVAVNTEE